MSNTKTEVNEAKENKQLTAEISQLPCYQGGEFIIYLGIFIALAWIAYQIVKCLCQCLNVIYKNLCEDIRLLSLSHFSNWEISKALFNSAIPLLPLCAAICVASIFIVSNPAGWALGALGVGVLLMAFAAVGISAGLSKLLHPGADNSQNSTIGYRKSLPNGQKQVEKDVNDHNPPHSQPLLGQSR